MSIHLNRSTLIFHSLKHLPKKSVSYLYVVSGLPEMDHQTTDKFSTFQIWLFLLTKKIFFYSDHKKTWIISKNFKKQVWCMSFNAGFCDGWNIRERHIQILKEHFMPIRNHVFQKPYFFSITIQNKLCAHYESEDKESTGQVCLQSWPVPKRWYLKNF